VDSPRRCAAAAGADQVHAHAGGHGLVDLDQELPGPTAQWVAAQPEITVPPTMLNAANKPVVPCRT
jgi:hypothetical protein